MKFTGEAIVLSSRRFNEASAVVSVLFEDHGVFRGVVKNSASPRNRGALLSGNVVQAVWQSRLAEQLGTFTLELVTPTAAVIMNDDVKLLAVSSLCSLLSSFIAERDPHPRMYYVVSKMLKSMMEDSSWYKNYLDCEVTLLAECGYGLSLEECAVTGTQSNLVYISPKTGRAVCDKEGEAYKDRLFTFYPALQPEYLDAITLPELINCMSVTHYFLQKMAKELLHRQELPTEYNLFTRKLKN